jgi:anti-sigma regulatory factor (Ser/Thr protein kinase)
VRKSVSAVLVQAGADESVAFDASLIASELVGNAVRHAPALPSGHLVVNWDLTGTAYTISVTDGGGIRELSLPTSTVWDTSGRGLSIVAAIADSWGVTPGEGSTTVWARGSLDHALSAGGQLQTLS